MIISQKRFFLLGYIFLLFTRTAVFGQEFSLENLLPGLRDRAIIMDIVARIVESDQIVVWYSENKKVTIPGRPVGIKLVGDNIVVAVQFTPYFRRRGNNFLVAQGQIWIDVPNKGVSYSTSMQTIPMEFGELIYFFPLGSTSTQQAEPRIEIELTLHPYAEETPETEQGNSDSP